MSGIDKCISKIIAETGFTGPKEAVVDVLEVIAWHEMRPKARDVHNLSPEQQHLKAALDAPAGQAMQEARNIAVDRLKFLASRETENVVRNSIKRAERQAGYAAAPSTELGIQAKLIGTNTPFEGNRVSAEAAINANKIDLVGGLRRELEDAGVAELFARGDLEPLWAKELYELNSKTGKPGVSGNAQALQIARAIHNAQKRSVELVNGEGGWVGRYDGYIARTTHSPDRLIRMGEDAWTALVRKTADLDTMFPNRDAAYITAALHEEYVRLASGKHESGAEAAFQPVGHSVARKASESRSIHFTDADAWLRYTAEASDLRPSQVVLSSLQRAARDAGLMRIWGTNPAHALKADIDAAVTAARDAGDFASVKRLNGQTRNFDLWMSYLDGSANQITNRTAAAVTQNWLSIQRLGKLGALPFSQLADLASLMGELRYQGVGFVDQLTAGVFAYFRGGVNSEKRQVARLLQAGVEGWLSSLSAHMEVADPALSGGFTGLVSKAQQWMFKYSGAQYMTDSARESFVHAVALHMGSYRATPFGKLPPAEQRILKAFKLGDAEWSALQAVKSWTKAGSSVFLTPDVAARIPAKALDSYITQQPIRISRAEARERIGQRLRMYLVDRTDYGVLNLGIGERAILYQGHDSGSPLGIALRLLTQFKSFMLANVRRTWGREIYGGQGTMGAVSGLVQFATWSTLLGITANGLSQLVKGQDPTSQWEKDPTGAVTAGFARGGGGAMLGDFAFNEFSRHGGKIGEYALGPSFPLAAEIVSAPTKLRKGQDFAGDLLRDIKGVTPLMNLWWSKMATDYLVWNGLAEAANPGYLSRLRRNLGERQGLDYFPGFEPENLRAF